MANGVKKLLIGISNKDQRKLPQVRVEIASPEPPLNISSMGTWNLNGKLNHGDENLRGDASGIIVQLLSQA